MNTLKTLLVAAVLSTVAYGLFSNYVTRPDAPPPSEATSWDTAPQVQLPPAGSPPTAGLPANTALPGTPLLAPTDPPITAQAATPPSFSAAPNAGPAFPALSAAPPPTPSITPPSSIPPVTPAPSVNTIPASEPPPVSQAVSQDRYGISQMGNAAPAAQPAITSPPAITTSAPPTAMVSNPSGPVIIANPTMTSPNPQVSLQAPYVDPTVAPVSSTPGNSPPGNSGPSAAPAGIAPSQPASDYRARFEASMAKAQGLLDAGQLSAALLTLSEWLDDTNIPAHEYVQLLDLLDRLAATVIYSREHLLEKPHAIQPGENLYQLAERFQVPWQLLAKVNGLASPEQIRPGEQLKVIRGPFDAVVNLRTNELTVLLRGHYAGRFPCAVGQDANTTPGEYAVRDKKVNPTYYGPNGLIDADDPNNPLGERQLDLGNRLSIHGAVDAQGPGANETRGSVRLSRADVEDVFDILSVGSRVVIKR